jgi:hypothetical protein
VAVFSPFENLTDPRVERTRAHDLFDVVVVSLCATIAGADSWLDVERFGNDRLAPLARRRLRCRSIMEPFLGVRQAVARPQLPRLGNFCPIEWITL